MNNDKMRTQISSNSGFIAALDQSGGSTPSALRAYGIPDNAYSGDEQMFQLMHEMRVRIISSPAFTGDKVIGVILFERTMDSAIDGQPIPIFLWEKRGIVPFLKIDRGREAVNDGVNLMKPIAGLDILLARAVKLGIFGTKMRSVIHLPSKAGIAAVVAQQFAVAEQIAKHGLVPIIEPEVLIDSTDKKGAEAILLDELQKGLASWNEEHGKVMLKLTIPELSGLYAPLIADPRVMRVLALSGGYARKDACRRLSENRGMIASFSRALVEELHHGMSDAVFDAALAHSIDEIFNASTTRA
jgi:fructose-bisphosphate aldolase, class I